MKSKNVKCLLCIIVAFLLIFTGCVRQNTEKTEVPTAAPVIPVDSDPNDGKPDSIVIVECQFYGDSMYNLDYKEAWPKALEEHYGVKVVVEYPLRKNYMETIEESAMSGDLTGIVELFGGPYLMEWMGRDWIYPVSDLLKDNDVWNNVIPEMWKDAYTFNDEVWALASGGDGTATWFTRSMRGDWLDSMKLEKPYTIDEFYEASYKFTYNDPDGNKKDDTLGFTSAGTWNLQDIFQAFDSRLSHVADPVPVWNPNTNIWEDSMIKPEMAECLEFLNKCYSEGVLDPMTFQGVDGAYMRNMVSGGTCGGTFYWDSWTLSFESNVKRENYNAYMVCVGALAGNIDKNLNQYGVGIGAPRVMMKNTPNAKETINWYVNTFYGDEWGYWTARIGPVGSERGEAGAACTIEGNKLVRNTYIDSKGNVRFYPSPGYIGGMPAKALYTVYEVAYHIPSDPVWAEDLAQDNIDRFNRRAGWIEEYIANGMAYILPGKLTESTSPLYLEKNDEIVAAAIDSISKAVMGYLSVEDALAMYKEKAKVIGVKEILDFENAKLGKATEQSYD